MVLVGGVGLRAIQPERLGRIAAVGRVGEIRIACQHVCSGERRHRRSAGCRGEFRLIRRVGGLGIGGESIQKIYFYKLIIVEYSILLILSFLFMFAIIVIPFLKTTRK